MLTNLHRLFSIESPWLTFMKESEEAQRWIPSFHYSQGVGGGCVRRLDGRRMRTKDGLMSEFSAALQFFEGFGRNWDALLDCLRSLDEWMPATHYILLVRFAEQVLVEEEEELKCLLSVMNDAAEWWSRPISDNDRFNRGAIPFHTLFSISVETEPAFARLSAAAKEQNVPFKVVLD